MREDEEEYLAHPRTDGWERDDSELPGREGLVEEDLIGVAKPWWRRTSPEPPGVRALAVVDAALAPGGGGGSGGGGPNERD